MKKVIIAIMCLAGIAGQVEAAYVGKVYVDKNKNGRQDKDEKALAGVMVTDGLNVVKTSSDGSFRLPGHDKERFITITTPSGYKTDNKYYIPISEDTRTYDFGVQPYAGGISSDGNHRFIHISDTEIFNTEGHEDWINSVRGYARNEEAAFIMHTGDICYEKGLRNHIELMNTANMNCPVFYGIGNHDLVEGKYGEELFEQLYGPAYYSFEVGNTHYLVTPMFSGDYQPSYTKEEVFRWVKNDLRHVPLGKPVVMFNHDLLSNTDQFRFKISDTDEIDLNEHNLKAWIYGHWHNHLIKKQGKVLTICTSPLDKGGIDHSTSAFRVMHVDGKGNVSSRLRYTYIDKQIEITSPGQDGFPLFTSGAMPVTVNTYHSVSPTKEVTYSCQVAGKKFVSNKKLSQQTDWSWKDIMYLGKQHVGKTVTLSVTATFNNGEKAVKTVSFPYTGRKPLTDLTDNWKNLLGDPSHTGTAKSAVNPPLIMAWTNNVGSNIYMTSPVIYKGNIYVASVDEDLTGKACIYALGGQTGDILWKYFVDNSIKNTIVVDDDIVFAQTVQGTLYAIDAKDGSLKWGSKLHVGELPALVEGLVVSDGVIYAGTGSGLCALNTKTGDKIWRNTGWEQGEGATSTLSLGNGILISSSQWRGLYANDSRTGEFKWHQDKSGLRNRGASAAIHDNLLYVTSTNSLFIMDPAKGNIIVRKEYPFSVDVTSTPLVTDWEIVFGSVTDGLIAVDKETLEIKWKYQTNDALIYTAPYTRKPAALIETSPVLSGNTIYFGASDGTLYGIDREKGEAVWKHATGAPVFGSMAVSGNTLVAVDFGGNVYAFTVK